MLLYLLMTGQASLVPTDAWPLVLSALVLAIPVGGALAIFGMSEGMRLRERGRRLRYTRGVSLDSRRKPVLLLRSFGDDELLDPRPLDFFQRRYEETLARTLRRLGPVVCIGRPNDSFGFGGAARLYVTDEHWRKAVCHLMERAVAVVIVVGRTEGLWWEIDTAIATMEPARLLFFFPYGAKSLRSGSRIADLWEFVGRWNLSRRRYDRMEAERRERYREFSRRCQFLHPLPEDPGRALFLDLLPDGKGRLLLPRRKASWKHAFGLANVLVDYLPGRMGRLRFDVDRTLQPFLAKLAAEGRSDSS
ncbi:MAG: hypothetical protein HC861_01565 [Rhodospirillaceae bacterium]|nr:hypothetical protein [Rhodospirillaceae bacterium]